MGSGSFPIDLLLFGMIAAFLVLRLRGILGRKTGFERPAQPDAASSVVPGMGRAGRAARVRQRALARMRAAERGFDPQHFLNGAETAFRMIVGAFAAGDRVTLRPLLSDDTYRSFESAIAAREAAGETQRSEIRGIENLTVEDAALSGNQAAITLRIVSDQVSETLDRDGKPVAGADAVAEITDIWTFERTLNQPDPAWRLSAARSG